MKLFLEWNFPLSETLPGVEPYSDLTKVNGAASNLPDQIRMKQDPEMCSYALSVNNEDYTTRGSHETNNEKMVKK